MKKYPNIEALAQGCVSGQATDWVQMRPEAEELLAEVERLRRERDVAIRDALRIPPRIAYGWDSKLDEMGYFVDGDWAGREYLDAIKAIAAEEGGEL